MKEILKFEYLKWLKIVFIWNNRINLTWLKKISKFEHMKWLRIAFILHIRMNFFAMIEENFEIWAHEIA